MMSIENLEATVKELETVSANVSELITKITTVSEAFASLGDALEKSPASNELWQLARRLAEMLANAARSESIRTPIGEAGILSHLSRLLKLTSNDQSAFRIQALRVYGNACFDHEGNRKRVYDAEVIPLVMPYLEESQNPDLIRTACGFCLNSSMDYQPIQAAICNGPGLRHLLCLLQPARMDHGETATVAAAAKVLSNLVNEDSARGQFTSKETVSRLLELIKYEWEVDRFDDLGLLESLADILLQAVAEDDNGQIAVVESGYFGMLLDFLEHAELPPEEAEDEEEKKQFEEAEKSISKIAIYATSTDAKMKELYNDSRVLPRFVRWFDSDSEILLQTAIYSLGNLARTDEHCIDLVKTYQLERKLLEIFKAKDHPTLQYAILGCLKHLCLPKQNKAIIGDAGAIPTISTLLDPSKDLLKRNQFLAVGIIKLLCSNEYANSERVITVPTATESRKTTLELILDFIGRVDDVGAKSEATRVLTNMIKSVWMHSFKQSSTLRKKLIQGNVVQAIAELARTSAFVVLQNDSIMALTLILADSDTETAKDMLMHVLEIVTAPPPKSEPSAADTDGEQPQRVESQSFLGVIVDIATSTGSNIPEQIRCNACVLLEKIVKTASAVQDNDRLNQVKEASESRLKTVEASQSMVAPFAAKVLEHF